MGFGAGPRQAAAANLRRQVFFAADLRAVFRARVPPARFTAFLYALPCCCLTRCFAFARARLSSLALCVEEILAIFHPYSYRQLHDQRFVYFVNGIPNSLSKALPSSSVLAVVTIDTFNPLVRSTLLKSISGKINWSLIPTV